MNMVRILAALLFISQSSAFTAPSAHARQLITPRSQPTLGRQIGFRLCSTPSSGSETQTEISKAPTLNGKAILPVRAMVAGLKGHKIAAVYAVLNSSYKRGSGDGWECVEHISITKDLASDINYFLSQKGSDTVAHIRALSFSYPQKATMEDFANSWRFKVQDAGIVPVNWGKAGVEEANAASESEFDEDDEDMDEDELDDYLQMMAESRAATSNDAPLFVDNTSKSDEVVSPFAESETSVEPLVQGDLELNDSNVDTVLDEVRPYLISDGGNVSVQKVDAEFGNVYLMLEGACGSCASSTVTMKMGIERVLKEKFGSKLNDVIQVDPEEALGEGKATELTMESVQSEVKRLSQAITAMGGVVNVVNVDPIGVVDIEFRGPNKVKKGLELALLDIEFVKHVNFVS